MANAVQLEQHIAIPLPMETLDQFRDWALSNRFPERGRIDFIRGSLEVDMSPEDFFTHGTLKSSLAGVLARLVDEEKLGYLLIDSMRVSSPLGDVSSEPDILFISKQSLQSQRVQLTPKASGEAGRFVEIVGAPDVVVEIVSDSSVHKDTLRLPEAWFAAGLNEYWLLDARAEQLVFTIHRRGESGFEPQSPDQDDYQRSDGFDRSFRIERYRDDLNFWAYRVFVR